MDWASGVVSECLTQGEVQCWCCQNLINIFDTPKAIPVIQNEMSVNDSILCNSIWVYHPHCLIVVFSGNEDHISSSLVTLEYTLCTSELAMSLKLLASMRFSKIELSTYHNIRPGHFWPVTAKIFQMRNDYSVCVSANNFSTVFNLTLF